MKLKNGEKKIYNLKGWIDVKEIGELEWNEYYNAIMIHSEDETYLFTYCNTDDEDKICLKCDFCEDYIGFNTVSTENGVMIVEKSMDGKTVILTIIGNKQTIWFKFTGKLNEENPLNVSLLKIVSQIEETL